MWIIINKVYWHSAFMSAIPFQSYQNQILISYEQIMLIFFEKKRKLFTDYLLGNSNEYFIFARSYSMDKKQKTSKLN